ncbi:hypothetical protein MAP00_005138 [Monascus purpureus]|nr:hypothetical protein MAP00_005138 [Monascus purpureus]
MLADRRSSSEEKESLTPAQNRRKAQNRAAQRAFRERKERHVRELEEKVASLEQASKTLQADNERLKQELTRFATENEILRATSKAAAQSNHNDHARSPLEEPVPGPMEYSPTDFFSLIAPEGGLNPPHRVTFDETTGEKLLSAAATWDLIQSHELFKRGLVDIGDISERLKGLAQCNGQGPAFKESQVRQAIQASVAGGSDELI